MASQDRSMRNTSATSRAIRRAVRLAPSSGTRFGDAARLIDLPNRWALNCVVVSRTLCIPLLTALYAPAATPDEADRNWRDSPVDDRLFRGGCVRSGLACGGELRRLLVSPRAARWDSGELDGRVGVFAITPAADSFTTEPDLFRPQLSAGSRPPRERTHPSSSSAER